MRFHPSTTLRLGIGLTIAAATVKSDTTGSWRSDLPWTDLASKLSSTASLIDTAPSNYLEECTAEFDKPYLNRTHHELINQPSGLCMNQLFCAYDRCDPNPGQSDATITDLLNVLPYTTITDLLNAIYDLPSLDTVTYSGLPTNLKTWIDDGELFQFGLLEEHCLLKLTINLFLHLSSVQSCLQPSFQGALSRSCIRRSGSH